MIDPELSTKELPAWLVKRIEIQARNLTSAHRMNRSLHVSITSATNMVLAMGVLISKDIFRTLGELTEEFEREEREKKQLLAGHGEIQGGGVGAETDAGNGDAEFSGGSSDQERAGENANRDSERGTKIKSTEVAE